MITHPATRRFKGEKIRFWVEARSKADWHVVDMSTRGGHGMCDCEMFRFCAAGNYRRHGRFVAYEYHPDTGKCGNSHEASECAHIRAVREQLYQEFIMPMWAFQEQGETEWFKRLADAMTKKNAAPSKDGI